MLIGIYASTRNHVVASAFAEGFRQCEAQTASRNLDYYRGEVEDFDLVLVEDGLSRGRLARDAYQARGIVVAVFNVAPDGRLRVEIGTMEFDPLTLEEVRDGGYLRAMFEDGKGNQPLGTEMNPDRKRVKPHRGRKVVPPNL